MPPTTITIRPRQPTDLPSCASLLTRVYERDAYPVQGVSQAVEFLSSPSTLAAWVAVAVEAESQTATTTTTNKHTLPSPDPPAPTRASQLILAHVSLTLPSPSTSTSDPAVALWQSQNHPEPIAVLERLFVDPEARGQGLAAKLLRVASEEAGKRGLRAVLFALVKDEGAMRLYERVGWREFGRSVYAYSDHEGRGREMEAVCYVGP